LFLFKITYQYIKDNNKHKIIEEKKSNFSEKIIYNSHLDSINEEYEKYKDLNDQTKIFISKISPKSVELFMAMVNKKRKELYYDNIKENERLDIVNKENIIDSICYFYDEYQEKNTCKII